MASLRLRWSEHEARKPYARPFMVSFLEDGDEVLGSVAVNGADLLYWRQFGTAVAGLCGELFLLEGVGHSADPQRAWLDLLEPLLPAAGPVAITPRSAFDHARGRVFGFAVAAGSLEAVVDAPTLLEYQDFQAALAHQTGRLLRVEAVERVDDADPRRTAWLAWLDGVVSRPAADEAMSPVWPWR